MKNDFFKSMSSIILEAEKDEDPIEVEDYSMDEGQLEDGNDEEDTQVEEKPEDQDETEEQDPNELESDSYSMDNEQLDDGTEEGMGDETSGESEDMETTDGSDEETISENHKKYVLLRTYKGLLLDVANLQKSFSILGQDLDGDLYEHYTYISSRLNTLKEKINFVIQREFLKNEYSNLLTSFLYFQKELDAILELVEKLIKTNNE